MGIVAVILYVIVVLVALMLIGLILIQQSKGGGFGSAFGGAGESVFGAHAASHLTKFTVILTTIFFLFTLALAIITGHSEQQQEAGFEKVLAEESSAAPAAVPEKAVTKSEAAVPEKPVKAVEKTENAKASPTLTPKTSAPSGKEKE